MSQAQKVQKSSNYVKETSYLIDDEELSKKQQRMRDAVMLYYGDNDCETLEDVAEEIGVRHETVSRYLNSDESKGFRKIFSHRNQDEIERWLEDMAARHFNKAMEALDIAIRRAKEDDDVSPQVLTNAATSLIKADHNFAKNLQEINAIPKPKDRVDYQNNGGEQVSFEMRYTDAEEEDGGNEDKKEVEA